ncbi:electron transfer flavoprotein subunit alpha/FixB family protein [Nocardioides caldifontis]|uniref:electron transfer flavoprotein subunit alpha/FixB family protein n=1 Tax=Nocardioides caldifontis TaxID=2588938 RepID=UPI0011E01D43|nr:electron transfer flavoprotein subunit alpha/FixB family protein [Nocardioides caldifontis]
MSTRTALVLLEPTGGALSEVSAESLTFARHAAAEVHALVVGADASTLAEEAGRLGATVVHGAAATSGDAFSAYAPAAWAAAVVAAVEASGATLVLAAGTPRGNEVLAHVACRLGVAMAANVVQVDGDDGGSMVVSRQVLGGTALEEMRLTDRVALLTVAGHACEIEPAAAPAAAEVRPLDVALDPRDLVVRVVETVAGEPDASGALKSAKVVVGAGRGVGSADGFKEITDLADLLGGAVGVSRVVTSLGWRPHHEQVGQTGSRISPDVYIPCGISGAIQHWAGCSSAKTILAINTDAEAPMVTKAHYAVIGDLHEVVPAINEELRRRRG